MTTQDGDVFPLRVRGFPTITTELSDCPKPLCNKRHLPLEPMPFWSLMFVRKRDPEIGPRLLALDAQLWYLAVGEHAIRSHELADPRQQLPHGQVLRHQRSYCALLVSEIAQPGHQVAENGIVFCKKLSKVGPI